MMPTRKEVSIKEVLDSIAGASDVLGTVDGCVSTPSPFNDASECSISFCSATTEDARQIIRNSKAGVVICHNRLRFGEEDYKDKTLIRVADPKLAFVQVLRRHFEEKVEFAIHPTAVLDEGARIHQDVHIGPHCYIGRCQIGKGTIIYGNVYIYSNVKIGNEVIINAGTVIGAE